MATPIGTLIAIYLRRETQNSGIVLLGGKGKGEEQSNLILLFSLLIYGIILRSAKSKLKDRYSRAIWSKDTPSKKSRN